MTRRNSPDTSARATSTTPLADRQSTASRQVSWYATYEFWRAVIDWANVGPLPWPGTPAWCALADGDPRKLLALAEFGVHHALRVDSAQESMAQTSRDVSAAEDWGAVARSIRRHADAARSGAHIPRAVI